jgi:hypothetical protein
MSAFELSYVLLWIVTCVLLAGVAALYSAVGALTADRLKSRPALDLSAVGPALQERVDVPQITDLAGHPISRSGERWVFVTPDCPGCGRAKTMLQSTTLGELGGGVVVVCRAPRDEVARWAADVPGWAPIVCDEDGRLFATFNVDVTPFYVVLDGAGVCVAKGPTDVTLLGQAAETNGSRRLPVAEQSAHSGVANRAEEER